MKQWLRRLILLVAILCVGCSVLGAASRPEGRGPGLRSRFAREVCRFGENRSPADGPASSCSRLDELVDRSRSATRGTASPTEAIDRLNRFFFETERFEATSDLSSPDHLLPGRVLAGKKGYCVGLAAIYLALVEELHLPVHGVATPKHLFLRWDDGKFRRNIELFQKGREVRDEEYVREQKIPRESIEQGVFLADLTPKQFLGFLYQNLGVLESGRRDYEASGRDYRRAIRLDRKLAAAYYNRGNDALNQRLYRRAIGDYTRVLELYPTDVWALKNRGLVWKGLGEIDRAKSDWRRAREIDPAFKEPE